MLYLSEKATVNGLKAANLRSIMSCLLRDGEQTKLDLLVSTGLSSSTVSDVIRRLAAGHIVDESGSEQSSGGRRPVIYRIRPEAGYMAGCAMNDDRVDAVVTDLSGTVLFTHTVHLEKKTMLDMLYAAIDWARGCVPEALKAIGIGVRGRVQWKTGVVLEDRSCGWFNVPLKELLERRYGLPVRVDHRVNARALAEAYLGAAKGLNDYVCMYRDAPEKVALVSEGTLVRGYHGGAGKYHGKPESLFTLMDAQALVTDRENVHLAQCVRALRTGPDFSADCAVMAEIFWFDLLYDTLREARK